MGKYKYKNTKVQLWCFTLNNYTEDEIADIKKYECTAIKAGFEVGKKKGTPHVQGAVYHKNGKTLKQMRKWLPRAKFIEAAGNWEQQDYCLKDGDILRNDGTGPKQGERNDLAAARASIDAGATEAELWQNHFNTMLRYGRAMREYQDSLMENKFRTWMTKGIWYWGETGVGKSHTVFDDYDPKTHYIHQIQDKGWWDGYRGQPIVIINEFRGEIPYSQLLDLMDKWPTAVSRRGRAPRQFLAKEIRITSSMPPEKVYCRQNEKDDSINQLLRRCEVVHLESRE